MALSALHWQAAAAAMQDAFRALSGALLESDFYLAGGTALALLDGHRVSVDLALFSPSFEDPEAVHAMLEKVVPEFISVVDDPTQRKFGDVVLNGHYRFDEEGVPAQSVTLVEGGVLDHKRAVLLLAPVANIDVGEMLAVLHAGGGESV